MVLDITSTVWTSEDSQRIASLPTIWVVKTETSCRVNRFSAFAWDLIDSWIWDVLRPYSCLPEAHGTDMYFGSASEATYQLSTMVVATIAMCIILKRTRNSSRVRSGLQVLVGESVSMKQKRLILSQSHAREIYPFPNASRSALRPHIQWVLETLSLGVGSWRGTDHSPSFRTEIKNEYSYISTPSYAFMACTRKNLPNLI